MASNKFPQKRGVLTDSHRGDTALAVVFVSVVALMIVPVPPGMLDVLIAINLGVSAGLLTMALYTRSPLALSTFPSLLLMTTIYRLGLNVASTKQILLNGHAGQVIDAFGHLVVGGNVVVGIVVFLVIVVVQLLVVAKGSERVAEVSARFTLDAIPGKQMSIDADLRAGLITGDEARARREELDQESRLFGALDGAMKFVKGDAIAGVLIALLNIVAGITIGVMMMDMEVGDAVARFTVLTVGDGVVSQIPSLLVSVAAGVLITRVSSARKAGPGALGADIAAQIATQPRSLIVAGVLMLALCAVPGLPLAPFMILGGGMVLFAISVGRAANSDAAVSLDQVASLVPDNPRPKPPVGATTMKTVSPVTLVLSSGDYQSLDAGVFDRSLWTARERISESLGLPFPGLLMQPSDDVAPGEYVIKIQGVDFERGYLSSFGDGEESYARSRGGLDSESVAQRLVDALEVAISKSAPDLLTFAEVQSMMRNLTTDCPELAGDLVKVVPTVRMAEILRRLLSERVSIRNIQLIAESLLSWGAREKDPVLLTERLRCDLARQISNAEAPDGVLSVITVAPRLEDTVRASLQQTPGGATVVMDPETKDSVIAMYESILGDIPETDPVVVICPMDVRPHLAKIISQLPRRCSVLSHGELSADVELSVVGMWDVD